MSKAAHREPALKVVRDGKDELERLATRHRTAVKHGFEAFIEAGDSLEAIRKGFHDDKFTDSGFKNFEAFAKAEFNYSKGRASQLINGAATARAVYHGKLPSPDNERQIRPLLSLPEEERPKAWANACKSAPEGKVTAKHVAAVVAEMLPPKETPEPRQGQRAPRVDVEQLKTDSFHEGFRKGMLCRDTTADPVPVAEEDDAEDIPWDSDGEAAVLDNSITDLLRRWPGTESMWQLIMVLERALKHAKRREEEQKR